MLSFYEAVRHNLDLSLWITGEFVNSRHRLWRRTMTQIIKLSVVLLACMYWLASTPLNAAQKPHDANSDTSVQTVQEVKEVISAITIPANWPVHATVMSFTTILLIIGMFIARNRSKDRFWLPKHQTLGVVSPFLMLIGFGSVSYMLLVEQQPHFEIPHAWYGLTVTVLTFLVPTLGFVMMKKPGSKMPLRKIHVWIGRLTILGMLGVIVSGLFAAGLFMS